MPAATQDALKIVCDRSALVDALTLASSVVLSRTTVPVLLCVKLTARDGTLRLSATDQDLRLSLTLSSVEVHSDGDALVPADKLSQIVRSCDDSTLAIEMDKQIATVRSEDAKFRVFGYDPREFPAETDAEASAPEFEIAAGHLRRMIGRSAFATAADNSRYAFNGVLLERKGRRLRMVATDGRRLALVQGECTGSADGDSACIIPTKTLQVLNRLLDDPDTAVRISRNRNRIRFEVGETATVISSLIEGTFPPFDDVIPKEHDRRASFDTAELAAAVKRAALLTNEESKGVKFSFADKTLTISSRAAEMGEAEVRVAMRKWEGKEIDIAFNPGYVTDVLRIADSSEIAVEMKAPNRPGVFKVGEDLTYVIMPVSLPG